MVTLTLSDRKIPAYDPSQFAGRVYHLVITIFLKNRIFLGPLDFS